MKRTDQTNSGVREKIAYNRILNPNFWQNGKFDQEVRTKLLQIANDFYTDLKVDAPIVDIHLTGSMASYTWTEMSDVDVHVHIDFSLIDENTELVKQALEGQKFVWKLRHPVRVKGHDVELYVQDDKSHTVSAGIYSLLKDEWITKPTYDPPTIDSYEIAEKVEDYKKEIEELGNLLKQKEVDDARLIFDRAKVLKKKISSSRDSALKKSGEFSAENLIFKELRSQGYIGKLIKLQAKAYSAIYSDPGYDPDETKIMQEKEQQTTNESIVVPKINTNFMHKKIVESFSQYITKTALIFENIAAAKAYMKKRAAEELGVGVNDLTPQQVDKVLNNRDYLKILDMLRDQPGYVMAFVKFRFGQRINLDQLKELAQTLKTQKHIIQRLPTSVDNFASMQTAGNQITGFEQLNDAIRTIERTKEAKWFVDRLPKPLRDKYRMLPKEKQMTLVNAAHALTELGNEVVARLMDKIKAMSTWEIDDVIAYVENFLKGYGNANMKQKVNEIIALEPEAGLLYLDDRYLALSARTADSQKALCAVANWCINRGSFKSYADDAVQINIFDFGKPMTDSKFLTGTTIYYTGKVRTSHDINDASLYTTTDPKQHFLTLGYPEKMVDDLLNLLPVEIAVKRIIYDLKVNQLKPMIVLYNVIKTSYLIDPEADDEALNIAKQILIERVSDIATRAEILEMYVKFGVLSKFSFEMLNSLLPDLTKEELATIRARTVRLYSMINRAATSANKGISGSPQLPVILKQQKDILSKLGVSDEETNRVVESLEEMIATMADAPVKTPTRTPTKTPTKPSTPSRPSPIPTKRPFNVPEPAKASEEDVLKRLNNLLNGKDI